EKRNTKGKEEKKVSEAPGYPCLNTYVPERIAHQNILEFCKVSTTENNYPRVRSLSTPISLCFAHRGKKQMKYRKKWHKLRKCRRRRQRSLLVRHLEGNNTQHRRWYEVWQAVGHAWLSFEPGSDDN